MDDTIEQLERLVKALEAGTYVVPLAKLDIATATGAELDKIAELWGLKRNSAIDPMYGNPTVESDKDLRHRVKSYTLDAGFINPNIVDPNSIDFGDINVDVDGNLVPVSGLPELEKSVREKFGPKCECGAATASGYTQPGPGHASYCPLVTK